MPKCPKCNHQWLDKAKSEGGKKSKRNDMGKGSPGQIKAQEGKRKKKCITIFTTHSPEQMLDLSDADAELWFEGKRLVKEGKSE